MAWRSSGASPERAALNMRCAKSSVEDGSVGDAVWGCSAMAGMKPTLRERSNDSLHNHTQHTYPLATRVSRNEHVAVAETHQTRLIAVGVLGRPASKARGDSAR